MGFEDDNPTIEDINDHLAEQRREAEIKRAETIQKMEQNRIEDEQAKAKLKALSNTLGIDQMREDIDAVKININYLGERMGDMVKAINNISASLQGQAAPQEAGAVTAPGNKLNVLLDLFQSPIGDKLLSRLFPENQPQSITPLISQDLINEKMTNAFMQDLETGESIRRFISDTLKKKATQTIVKTALSDMRAPVVDSDEPA